MATAELTSCCRSRLFCRLIRQGEDEEEKEEAKDNEEEKQKIQRTGGEATCFVCADMSAVFLLCLGPFFNYRVRCTTAFTQSSSLLPEELLPLLCIPSANKGLLLLS